MDHEYEGNNQLKREVQENFRWKPINKVLV
jgi:hypothetical protein